MKLNTHRIFILLIPIFIMIVSCNIDKETPGYTYMDDMYRSPAVKTYEPSIKNFRNSSALKPVEGTISRGYVPYDIPNTNEGYETAKIDLNNPYKFNEQDMLKAKELYTVYCGVCHGTKGAGQGILVKREKILGIPSYADQGRAITSGSTYHVIYYGKNTMGSYANQLNEKERWMVTSYVMKLKSELSK